MKEEGRFYVYSSDEAKFRTFYSSFAEKLLCADCEALFSGWESYAKQFFAGSIPLSGEPVGNHLRLSGVDYSQMKLFFMSLLWRFGVTTNPWMKGASLGTHQERLRRRLLSSKPGEVWRYGCSITAITVDGQHVPDLIIPPSLITLSGRHFHRVVVGGFLLSFIVTSHIPKLPIPLLFIQETGEFILSRMEIWDIPFLADVAADAAALDPED